MAWEYQLIFDSYQPSIDDGALCELVIFVEDGDRQRAPLFSSQVPGALSGTCFVGDSLQSL